MTKNFRRFILLPACLALSACSTTPRDFRASLSSTPENQDKFTRDFAVCRMMVDRGINYKKDQAIATGSGTAIYAGGTSVAFHLALDNLFTTAGTGTTTALSVGAPVVGAFVSVAIAQSIKGKREKQLKAAMGDCLGQFGYEVAEWTPDRLYARELPAILPRDPAKPVDPLIQIKDPAAL